MALTGTPNNYNLVDTREEMFSIVNTNTEKQNKNLSAEDHLLIRLLRQKAAVYLTYCFRGHSTLMKLRK